MATKRQHEKAEAAHALAAQAHHDAAEAWGGAETDPHQRGMATNAAIAATEEAIAGGARERTPEEPTETADTMAAWAADLAGAAAEEGWEAGAEDHHRAAAAAHRSAAREHNRAATQG